jgi:hypothetical protein
MVLQRVPESYLIDTPGFETTLFTTSSHDALTLPDAVQFALDQNSVLQSAREAVAFRIAANGAYHANRNQTTRTAALYLRDGHTFCVAFDDDPAENILLARAQEGYEAHRSGGKWLVNKNEPLLRSALERATKANRIALVARESPIHLPTPAGGGTSEYGASQLVKAAIGDMAAPYAAFLRNKGFNSKDAWLLTTSDLERIGVDKKHVEIRRVGVGGVGYLYGLGADYQCCNDACARGVRQLSA